jgi:hypothetical protein
MKFSKKDDDDLIRLNEIITQVYTADIAYFDLVVDKIFANQPYVIEFYLSYRNDIIQEALGEVIKICFVIWEFFDSNLHVKYTKITDNQALVFVKKNHHMLAYLEGELANGKGDDVVESNIVSIRSKALLAFVHAKMNNCQALLRIDIHSRGLLLRDFQSLIECFEENEVKDG